MRIAVVGAGLVGVCTAWELAADGHDLVVFERHDSVAAESSFAPGGVLAPGAFFDTAWPGLPAPDAAPSMDGEPPLVAAARPDARTQDWLRRWSRAGEAGPRATAARLIPLLRYGHERWLGLLESERIQIERSTGALVLLAGEAELAKARPWLRFLAEQGLRFSLLDEAGCRRLEPGLAEDATMRAGVQLVAAESINARQLVQQLKLQLQRRGVAFRFNTNVSEIVPGAQPSVRHEPATVAERSGGLEGFRSSVPPVQPPGEECFDRVVVCAGLDAAALAGAAASRLPMAAIWGASVTVPIRHLDAHPDLGPRQIVLDARNGASICRFGRRLRASAGGWLTASGKRPDAAEESRLETQVYAALDRWFPGSFEASKAQRWFGARPSLPDGLPAVGASSLEGVWLNAGHGALGVALSLACARLLADAMSGTPTALPIDALAPGRFSD